MNSILDAIQAAQQRNMIRDQQNMASVAPVFQQPVFVNNSGEREGSDLGNTTKDNRTPAEMYADAVRINTSPLVQAPVIGTPIGMLNNAYIKQYEREYPELASKNPNRMYKSLFETVFGSVGDLFGSRASGVYGIDNMGAFPTTYNFNQGNEGSAREGTTDFGGRESAVGTEDRSGYA